MKTYVERRVLVRVGFAALGLAALLAVLGACGSAGEEAIREVQVERIVTQENVREAPAAASQSEAAPTAGPAQRTSAPTAAPPASAPQTSPSAAQPGATTFRDNERTAAVRTSQDSVSTFSLDTDRTSFQLALNWARAGYEVDPDSVRSEEWVNAFNYGYGQPSRGDSFAIHTDVMPHPLDSGMVLARIGFQAPELHADGEAAQRDARAGRVRLHGRRQQDGDRTRSRRQHTSKSQPRRPHFSGPVQP